MELRDLRYFVAVASELHYGRAAKRLEISKPGLSQQISSFESELGFTLLERNQRTGVRLSPEGEAFLVQAMGVIREADRALELAQALARGTTGRLRVSYVPAMFSGLPSFIVAEYQRQFPGVELTSDSGSTASNIEKLRNAELDVAFVLTPVEQASDLRWVDVATESIVVALPGAHPLRRSPLVHRQDLATLPLVIFPRRNSAGYYDRTLLQVYGSDVPTIVRTEPSVEHALARVAEGAGISLILESRAATLRYPGVIYRPFDDPEPTAVLGVAFRPDPSLAAQHLMKLAQAIGRQPLKGRQLRIARTKSRL